jgi:hypothetical protein
MTLLINEIWADRDLNDSLILFGADRRVTLKGKYHGTHKKIFKIKHLNAGVGYFGLAYPTQNQKYPFSSWIPEFIRRGSHTGSIGEFAEFIMESLNRVVPKSYHESEPSGFHICGFNERNKPELWFVRNIGRMDGFSYAELKNRYWLSEDFLARDYPAWRATIQESDLKGLVRYYVNGDVRSFHAAWNELSQFVHKMHAPGSDILNLRLKDGLIKMVRWKIDVIAGFYKSFMRSQIIGKPSDVLLFEPEKRTEHFKG